MVKYEYDAWGKPLDCTGTLALTLGVDNPFRYRGYVYDEEIGPYYLRSRYYNPEWGRFVNADEYIGFQTDLLIHNIFAHCRNQCLNSTDDDGAFIWVITPGLKDAILMREDSFSSVEENANRNCIDDIIIRGITFCSCYEWILSNLCLDTIN